ncbi:MAG: flagellar biosynthetic protein FliO [Burkholderiaceae bacterium]
MQPLWSSLLIFVLILAAIPASAWLLRRSQALRIGAGASLDVVGAVAVGTRERIAIVRADRKWLVVGVTPQTITLLAELDQAPDTAGAVPGSLPATVGTARFVDLLKKSMSRNG